MGCPPDLRGCGVRCRRRQAQVAGAARGGGRARVAGAGAGRCRVARRGWCGSISRWKHRARGWWCQIRLVSEPICYGIHGGRRPRCCGPNLGPVGLAMLPCSANRVARMALPNLVRGAVVASWPVLVSGLSHGVRRVLPALAVLRWPLVETLARGAVRSCLWWVSWLRVKTLHRRCWCRRRRRPWTSFPS